MMKLKWYWILLIAVVIVLIAYIVWKNNNVVQAPSIPVNSPDINKNPVVPVVILRNEPQPNPKGFYQTKCITVTAPIGQTPQCSDFYPLGNNQYDMNYPLVSSTPVPGTNSIKCCYKSKTISYYHL